jgi:RNA polymerase sigma-70 factor (ECF subfamily)
VIDPQEADRLALLARQGDAPALARLYREFAPAVLAYLRRATGELSASEDLLHDVFLHLMQGRGGYSGRGRFRQWLFALAVNAARDQARRLRSQNRLAERLAQAQAPAPAHAPSADVAVADRETVRQIEAMLADLPAEYAAAFHLRVREEFTYREMAEMTGDPEGTLRSRVHHTLKRLRARLAVPTGRPEGKTESEMS